MTDETEPTVLEHDPDEGCDGCLFGVWDHMGDLRCQVLDRCTAEDHRIHEPAPPDCPLRSGGVLVRGVSR